MNELNEVDLLDMTGTTKLEENYVSKSLNYGFQSAKNMTKLMFNDLMNSSDKDMVAGEKSKKRFDYNPDKKVEKLDNKISKRKEMMNIYRESELANRREYEYFYNSLGDNTFQKVTSQLVYGAASTLFNPIELTKNIAINTAVNALIPGSSVIASIGRFGVNMFSDTVDNYYSNTWEDKLLGLEREPSEKLVQAVGGAVVSNAVFPLVKITGKKVFNFATDNIFVKGKTINGDILEPIVFNNYRKELGEVTAIDLSHRDYKIADSIKKEVIKSQPIEEGMQRVFPKQEIKNNIIRERTGVEPGIVDFTKGREELLDIGNILKKKGIEIQAKSKKEINLSEAIRKSNRNMDKMALDWVDRYISAPYIVTKDGYKVETLKSMRDMHSMFYDTLSMSFKGQGYNDVLGEALEDKSVVNSVLFQVSEKKQMPFLIKDVDDPDWDIKKLDNFSYKKNNDFRRAIENGITYNVKENEALLKTSPKYNKYLSNTNNIESFAKEVADVFNDYKSKKITYDEVVAVLEAKRSKYETIAITKPNGGEMSYREFLNIGSKTIRDKEFNIDKLVNDVEPKDRDIAMVFQNYALYPHMSVYDNMAFGLKLRKYDKAEIDKRVKNAAEILGLAQYLERKPAALSGGQRQRVALGRAIVRDAKVFLMDEPLSNLDAKLRVAMRAEIAKLHRRLETTTIYVTHDQTEAMTMADRIVIMKDGFVQQIGTPQEVYNTPNNVFVAGFIGSPAMNFFTVTLKDGVITNGKGLSLQLPEAKKKLLEEKGYEGKELIFGIRPEDIKGSQIAIDTYPSSSVKAEVVVSELLGAETMLYTRVDDTEFVSKVDARDFHSPGETVELAFDLNKSHFFDKETEQVIR